MKKTLAIVATLCAPALFAAVEDVASGADTYGLVKVEATTKNTIVAVPWYELSGSGTTITISNIVKTANLSSDDMCFALNSDNQYDAWKLTGGQWVAQNQYVIVGGVPTVTETPPSAQVSLPPGKAIWIQQNGSSTNTFYLWGRSTGSTAVSTTIQASATDAVWNLLANPLGSAVTPDALKTTYGLSPAAGDVIFYPGSPLRLTYKDGKWKTARGLEWGNVSDAAINPGQGVWYVRAANAGETSVTWISAAK